MRPGRVALINILGLLILLIIAGIIFWIWHQSYYFYSTNDATVSAPTANVASLYPGVIERVDVTADQTVNRDTTFALLSPLAGGTVSAGAGGSGRTASVSPGRPIRLTSPLDGTIINLTAQPGQVVQPGQPLAQVADLSRAYITAYVDESRIGDIQAGQGVDVTVDAAKDVTFHGRVDSIVPATAATFSLLQGNNYASGNFTKVTQNIPVRIVLDGLQGRLLYPGTSANVTIHVHL